MRNGLLWCALLLTFSTAAAAEPKTWEYAGGQWQGVNSASTTQAISSPTLDRVEELLANKQHGAARKLAIRWVLAHPRHAQRDRGLYLIAQSLYQYGDCVKSFYYLDELLDEYPESTFFYPALELQYKIADRYLNGYKRRFLGWPMFHAYDEAIEMLFRIQQRSPGSEIAEKSLLRTANFYYNDQQYDFAADTYAAYLRQYPRSEIAPRVKLRMGYSTYAQFRGPRFDPTPAIDAREQLRDLVAEYPDLAKEEKLPGLIDQIDRNLARKLCLIADYYRRTHEPRGAAYTYRYVVKAYPDTIEAQQAQAALRQLPGWALNATPEPAITPGYGPGTAIETPRMLPASERKVR